LTELFFGKGVDPATYRGENKAPAYLSGKGKKLNNNTEKAITKKPIKEVQTKAPKNAKTAEKPRGTRKDYALDKKLKEVKKKSIKK
jgi:hypothetical protein